MSTSARDDVFSGCARCMQFENFYAHCDIPAYGNFLRDPPFATRSFSPIDLACDKILRRNAAHIYRRIYMKRSLARTATPNAVLIEHGRERREILRKPRLGKRNFVIIGGRLYVIHQTYNRRSLCFVECSCNIFLACP